MIDFARLTRSPPLRHHAKQNHQRKGPATGGAGGNGGASNGGQKDDDAYDAEEALESLYGGFGQSTSAATTTIPAYDGDGEVRCVTLC